MFSFDTKREPEKCQRFRRAGATKKGLLAPFNPKAEGSADLQPLSRCATAPPGEQAQQLPFPATTPPVKIAFEALRRARQTRNLKYFFR